MSLPTVTDVSAYLGAEASWTTDQIGDALSAEIAAQARACTVPQVYPDDLRAALLRRVQHALYVRNSPSGFDTTISEIGAGFARVGGTDSEVRRLEAPYRRLVVG